MKCYVSFAIQEVVKLTEDLVKIAPEVSSGVHLFTTVCPLISKPQYT